MSPIVVVDGRFTFPVKVGAAIFAFAANAFDTIVGTLVIFEAIEFAALTAVIILFVPAVLIVLSLISTTVKRSPSARVVSSVNCVIFFGIYVVY